MQLKINDKAFPLISSTGSTEMLKGHRRDVLTLTVQAAYNEVSEIFVDGSTFIIEDDMGVEYRYNTHTTAGPITDNRDGTVVVKMGKTNTKEQDLEDAAETAKAAVVMLAGKAVADSAEARIMRTAIETAFATLPDEQAAETPSLSQPWTVGEEVKPGDRRYYAPTGLLYKVREGQGHITQESWSPDKTPAMWAVVDVTHAGTVEDPIPAAKGMDYVYGKYYTDPEDGKLYLCKRAGEEDGGVINLQYLPHELIGQYFEEVTA